MTMLYILAAALFAAQAQPAPKAEPKPDPNAPLTMNGCVARDYTDKNVSAYTFVDATDGSRYRIKSRSASKYSGMAVQVVGSIENKKVTFVGGLYPSPNVAGQAGNIDPGKAAVAAMPGGGSNGTGNVDLPTLNVTRFSLGSGECRK